METRVEFISGIGRLTSPLPVAMNDRPSAVLTVVLDSTKFLNLMMSGQKWLEAPLSTRMLDGCVAVVVVTKANSSGA